MRLLFVFLLLSPIISAAQQPHGVRVTGHIFFEDNFNHYDHVKIYNLRTTNYVVPAANGYFELVGYRTDTFIFICQNYARVNLCYKDSLRQLVYEKNIQFYHLQVDISPVTISPDKTFDQIQQEIDNLGVQNTDTYKDVNTFESPISALYELFSKTEKEKRAVAILMNDDMRRKMMRELLRICIKSNLIALSFSECDAFIDYCGFTDEYLQHTNLYDMLNNIKQHYKYYSGYGKQ